MAGGENGRNSSRSIPRMSGRRGSSDSGSFTSPEDDGLSVTHQMHRRDIAPAIEMEAFPRATEKIAWLVS
jgi:hypothetical protein